MSDTPFMPLWIGDFIADTMDLDAKELGAYMLLLMSMWTRDGRLPNDQKKLQRVARVGRDWPKVWAAIECYFEADGDTITNPRLSKELHKVNMKREVNAHAGARGGRAKALKYNKPHLANATISPKQPEPEPYKEKRDTKVSTKKRGQRLPENWTLPRDWGVWAIDQGWAEATVRVEAEKFKDYWISKSGRDAAKLDWLATWRNWMRNSKTPKISAINGGTNDRPTNSERRLSAISARVRQAR